MLSVQELAINLLGKLCKKYELHRAAMGEAIYIERMDELRSNFGNNTGPFNPDLLVREGQGKRDHPEDEEPEQPKKQGRYQSNDGKKKGTHQGVGAVMDQSDVERVQENITSLRANRPRFNDAYADKQMQQGRSRGIRRKNALPKPEMYLLTVRILFTYPHSIKGGFLSKTIIDVPILDGGIRLCEVETSHSLLPFNIQRPSPSEVCSYLREVSDNYVNSEPILQTAELLDKGSFELDSSFSFLNLKKALPARWPNANPFNDSLNKAIKIINDAERDNLKKNASYILCVRVRIRGAAAAAATEPGAIESSEAEATSHGGK